MQPVRGKWSQSFCTCASISVGEMQTAFHLGVTSTKMHLGTATFQLPSASENVFCYTNRDFSLHAAGCCAIPPTYTGQRGADKNC